MMNFIKKRKRQFKESAWKLGICEQGYSDLKSGNIHWIDNGIFERKKWFADPFILDFNNEIISLLVEEFDYKIHRGRIARLKIDKKDWTISDCKIILDLGTHLSFPMIWREGEHIYVCPENYKSGAWHLYEYNTNEEELIYKKTIINEKMTDAIFFNDDNGYYIFSTFSPTPNGNILSVYHADSLFSDFNKIDEVLFDENIARNAGMIFPYQGKKYRPAQECNYIYGHAIVFQEVCIQNERFSFKPIFCYTSTHPVFRYGAHTYNEYRGMGVIDVKGFRYRHLGKWLFLLEQVVIKLHFRKNKKLN